MDYDVITANDFGGEAFISLNTVSGVEHGSSSVDNFHGLKPLQLALMFQKQKGTKCQNQFKILSNSFGSNPTPTLNIYFINVQTKYVTGQT